MPPKLVNFNGGAASHVASADDFSYADLDLIFPIEVENSDSFDRLQLLDGLRSNLQEFHTALEEEEKEERVSSKAEVRQAIQSLQNMVEDVLDTLERHQLTHSTSSTSTQNENDIIEENAEYMESVEEPQVGERKEREDIPEEERQPEMEAKTADDVGTAYQEAEEAPTVPTHSLDEEKCR
ncbi:hypothetical protein GCK32_021895, partial [Trichostrongylus colubriformis]